MEQAIATPRPAPMAPDDAWHRAILSMERVLTIVVEIPAGLLVLAIHDYVSAVGKDSLKFSGGSVEVAASKSAASSAPKAKRLPKLKAAAVI